MTAPPAARQRTRRAARGKARPAESGGRHASPIDPRIRARRAEVLRSEARRRLHVALVVIAVVVVVVGGWFVLHSRLFAARVVTVVGAVHTPVDQIVAAAGLSDHPPLVDVGAAAAAGVERLPWVLKATVTREWPDGVRISVQERKPVATVREGAAPGRWAIVDRTGRVLAVRVQPPAGLPHVAGAGPSRAAGAGLPRVAGAGLPHAAGAGPSAPPGSTAGGLRAALRVVTTLPRAFAGQVASVTEGRDGDVTLELTSALTVQLGSTDQLSQKYEDVAAILKGASLTSGSTIDVAAPATPVVKP